MQERFDVLEDKSGREGFIYILVNPAFPNYVKIGRTTKDPEIRARELSSGTGVPAPYGVAWDVTVNDCHKVERLIHNELAYARARNDREFFTIPLRKAISVVSEIVAPFECDQESFPQTIVPEVNGNVLESNDTYQPGEQAEKEFSNYVPLTEELIQIADDSPVESSREPHDTDTNKTVARVYYETLMENPYKYNEHELRYEVFVVRRNRPDLKIDRYSIRRIDLVKKYGWGIHRNSDGKLALVACDSERYKQLLADSSVKKSKASRSRAR